MFGGGIIPEADIPELESAGVAKIFTPGATMDEIVDWVQAQRDRATPDAVHDGPRAA